MFLGSGSTAGLGWSAATDTLYVADLFNSRIRKTRLAAASRAVAVPAAGGLRTRRAIPAAPLSAMEQLRRSTTPGEPLRVMLWTGHSGPYHDHFHNGAVLAEVIAPPTPTPPACFLGSRLPRECRHWRVGVYLFVLCVAGKLRVGSPPG